MRLTVNQLRKIIKEEVSRVLSEVGPAGEKYDAEAAEKILTRMKAWKQETDKKGWTLEANDEWAAMWEELNAVGVTHITPDFKPEV